MKSNRLWLALPLAFVLSGPTVAQTAPAETKAPEAGANSFTEAQAKDRIEKAGFTQVNGLRKDDQGVDFGLWNRIPANCLICPLDVHVARVAKRFGLLTRERSDWQAAVELTENLSLLDKEDPAKYDFALFGLGVMENF